MGLQAQAAVRRPAVRFTWEVWEALRVGCDCMRSTPRASSATVAVSCNAGLAAMTALPNVRRDVGGRLGRCSKRGTRKALSQLILLSEHVNWRYVVSATGLPSCGPVCDSRRRQIQTSTFGLPRKAIYPPNKRTMFIAYRCRPEFTGARHSKRSLFRHLTTEGSVLIGA